MRLKGSLESKLKAGAPISEREVASTFQRIFDEEVAHLGRSSDLPRFSRGSRAALLRRYRRQIGEAVKDELQKLGGAISARRLAEAAVRAITSDMYWYNESGIVIAGFGSEEFFPSLRCYTADSIIGGKLRAVEEQGRRADITGVHTAVVAAFAQGDMVSLFMNGIDDDYAGFVRSFVGESFLVHYPDLVSQLISKHLPNTPNSRRSRILKQLRDAGDKLVSALGSGISQYANTVYSNPIVQIVDHLPKEELAAMAEALVNLTSFKRHVTGQAETVGGPIDVAVISRGDGLIWIKRKHYFEPGLNQHFLSNYYNDVTGGRRP
jgi:hypothetical protein